MTRQPWNWTSLGGSNSVTGSCHRVSEPDGDLLLDCGLYQGRREESWKRNRDTRLDLSRVRGILLTHAHLDHCGRIPALVAAGWSGPIYCTPWTAQLAIPILEDCAHIMAHDVEWLRRKGKEVHEPLYGLEEVRRTEDMLVPMDYGHAFSPLEGVTVHFRRASHILGAAMVQLERNGDGLLYTGDVGPTDNAFHRPREIPSGIRTLVMESTYGGRFHKPFRESVDDLYMEIERLKSTGGKMIIPCFAMERTQQMLALLHRKEAPGKVPIHVDSPLGIRLTKIYQDAQDEFMPEIRLTGQDPFGSPRVHIHETPDQSRRLNDMKGPMILLSSSGMCEGGRILHHLIHTCGDPRNTILVVGYMGEHTLGRRIVERAKTIKIFGDEHQLKARVRTINGFSAHGDENDLVDLVGALGDSLEEVRLVHGEQRAREDLAQRITAEFGPRFEGRVGSLDEGEAVAF